jgi:hypothetical protein
MVITGLLQCLEKICRPASRLGIHPPLAEAAVFCRIDDKKAQFSTRVYYVKNRACSSFCDSLGHAVCLLAGLFVRTLMGCDAKNVNTKPRRLLAANFSLSYSHSAVNAFLKDFFRYFFSMILTGKHVV